MLLKLGIRLRTSFPDHRARLFDIRSRFDLWEEVSSSSFFTAAVQHRSLREGAALASQIGQTSVVQGYETQAANILCFMQVSLLRVISVLFIDPNKYVSPSGTPEEIT